MDQHRALVLLAGVLQHVLRRAEERAVTPLELATKVNEILASAEKMQRPCLVANPHEVAHLAEWKAAFAQIGISVTSHRLTPEGQMYLMDEGVFETTKDGPASG
jgi:hypothetical protein